MLLASHNTCWFVLLGRGALLGDGPSGGGGSNFGGSWDDGGNQGASNSYTEPAFFNEPNQGFNSSGNQGLMNDRGFSGPSDNGNFNNVSNE